MTTLDRIVPILRQAAGLADGEPLDAQTGLVGSGLSLDSVAVLELIVAVENEFGIELPQTELIESHALETLGTLAALVEAKGQGGC